MSEPLASGSTIGILGGGQLGRMLSVAAARLGYRSHIYEPGAAPAADVASAWTQAPYEDSAALAAFAKAIDVVTYEFENVPADALDLIEATRPLRPNRHALAVSQDRLTEKAFLTEQGCQVAPYAPVDGPEDIAAALAVTGLPAILKTRRLGYDGKGQHRVTTEAEALAAAETLAGTPAVLEGVVPFTSEISVIAARGLSGEVACFDPGENQHDGGILRRTAVPAPIPSRLRTDAVLLAGKLLTALDYIGVLGVELFVTPGGVLVNEIAPRVHNSGHWTQNGCAVDQFEQHIRAVAGWPLGDGVRHSDVVMENLIGADMDRVPDLARESGVAVHLYGKGAIRAGRKMGHVNRVSPKA